MVAFSPGCCFLDDLTGQLIAVTSSRQSVAQPQKLASLQPLEHNRQTFAAQSSNFRGGMSAADLGVGMQRSFRIPDMFTGIFTLGFIGFIVNFAFLKIEQHFLAMARHQRRSVKGEM